MKTLYVFWLEHQYGTMYFSTCKPARMHAHAHAHTHLTTLLVTVKCIDPGRVKALHKSDALQSEAEVPDYRLVSSKFPFTLFGLSSCFITHKWLQSSKAYSPVCSKVLNGRLFPHRTRTNTDMETKLHKRHSGKEVRISYNQNKPIYLEKPHGATISWNHQYQSVPFI